MIPKNIYVFWHQDKLPLVVYKLFLNIKHKNPDFKVTKFCDRDVLNYILQMYMYVQADSN